jgi:nucleotide-binding universal stress UspA family protein
MFKTIAVGTDGTDTAEKAVDVAADIAERYQAQLLIFSAYEPVNRKQLASEREQAPEEMQWRIHEAELVDAMLGRTLKRVQERGLEGKAVAREGEPDDVLCELAAEHDADLLVIGNKGMNRRVFGSVPRRVCQHAPCSVVVVKTT